MKRFFSILFFAIIPGGVLGFYLAVKTGVIKMTRGTKNNNPGNLRYTGTAWVGLDNPPQDEKGFCRFTKAVYGLRALGINVLSRYEAGDTTLYKLGHSWAPPSDNEGADDYGASLAKQTSFGKDEPYPFTSKLHLALVIKGICVQENGWALPYGWSDYETAATNALRHKGYAV